MAHQLQPLSDSDQKAFVIPPGPVVITVGRSRGNDFQVEDTSVSSQHASLERNGSSEITLIDRGSSNGTFVNGEKITRRDLVPGDLIRIASCEFRYSVVEPLNGELKKTQPLPLVLEDDETRPLTEAISGVEKERDNHEEQIQSLRSEVESLTTSLTEKEGEIGSLSRDLDLGKEKEARLVSQLSEVRATNLDAEGKLATLQFELAQDKTTIERLNAERLALAKERDHWYAEKEGADARIAELEQELASEQRRSAALAEELEAERQHAREVASQFLQAMESWIPGEQDEHAEKDGLARLELMKNCIRDELDKIEPIWFEFGDGVQDELKRRCNDLKLEQRDLTEENRDKRKVLEQTEKELAEIRETVDEEIRRAQGLSRRGTKVTLPEGYDTMVIAKDREQAIYEELIAQIEYFESLLVGYRKNRKLKDAVEELDGFRKRLEKILSAQGVEQFEIPIGTMLTLKQRREVQILGKKGWGTRDFIEQPYQPGEVTKVIRPGYRVGGEEEKGVILRKVEVLIREASE